MGGIWGQTAEIKLLAKFIRYSLEFQFFKTRLVVSLSHSTDKSIDSFHCLELSSLVSYDRLERETGSLRNTYAMVRRKKARSLFLQAFLFIIIRYDHGTSFLELVL